MIYINCHEPPAIAELLKDKAEIKIENFSPADYIIGDIAIERKSMNDFLSSLASGRLFKQLLELKYFYPKTLLLLEGFELSFIRKTDVFYSVLLKILFGLNIKIIFSGSIEQTADMLYALHKKICIENKQKSAIARISFRRKNNAREEKEAMLCSLLGIGIKRAKALLSKFGSVSNIINAKEEELLSVHGIGKKAVKEIKGV